MTTMAMKLKKLEYVPIHETTQLSEARLVLGKEHTSLENPELHHFLLNNCSHQCQHILMFSPEGIHKNTSRMSFNDCNVDSNCVVPIGGVYTIYLESDPKLQYVGSSWMCVSSSAK